MLGSADNLSSVGQQLLLEKRKLLLAQREPCDTAVFKRNVLLFISL